MSRKQYTEITAIVLDAQDAFTISELCRSCDVAADDLIAMVEEGLLRPVGPTPPKWRFPAADLPRLRTARRLQHDLGVNLAGAALAVELLDELRSLRARMRVLENLLE